MLHMAHLSTKSLGPGAQLTILGLPMIRGDTLDIQYRNGERKSAGIVSCTANAMEIAVLHTRWRLSRVKVNWHDEPVPLSQVDGEAITLWEI